jgi:hypothetical protein
MNILNNLIDLLASQPGTNYLLPRHGIFFELETCIFHLEKDHSDREFNSKGL